MDETSIVGTYCSTLLVNQWGEQQQIPERLNFTEKAIAALKPPLTIDRYVYHTTSGGLLASMKSYDSPRRSIPNLRSAHCTDRASAAPAL